MWSLSRAIGSRWRRGEHSYEFFFAQLKPCRTLAFVCKVPVDEVFLSSREGQYIRISLLVILFVY